LVYYADPTDPSDIRSKIETALAAGANTELKSHVVGRFTWPAAAAALAEIYAAARKYAPS
jgi:hypothetical protein